MTVSAAPGLPHQRTRLTLALLAFAQFIVAVDYNIVYVALPDIGGDLGFTSQSVQWVVSAYAVAFGGLLLLGGRASDRLGARRIFTVALAIYGLSSLAGGLASTPGLLVAARTVQGIGGALLFPAILKLITTIYEEGTERTQALAVWSVAASGGLAAGALLGGLLTDWFGWESVFYVNVPLTVVALLAVPRLLPPDPPRVRGIKGFDLPGALIATAGVALVVFGLAGGSEAGWTASRTTVSLAVGVVLLVGFVLVEVRTRDPLAPPRLFRHRTLVISMLTVLLLVGSLAGEYYLFTTYLQNVLEFSPLEAGLAFLPLTVISMVGGAVAVTLLTRYGLRTTMSAGMLVGGAGIAAVTAGVSVDGSYVALLPGLVLWGIGGGVAFTAVFVAASAGVAPAEQGVANALASTFQQIGTALGLAVIIAVVAARPHGPASLGATATGVVDALRVGGWVSAAICAAGTVVALALVRTPRAAEQPAAASTSAAAGEPAADSQRQPA
ncbi:MFS transporter [Protofrankia symbiont of Coriaria ruscifolia]|uniref:Major facilitator superfamily protein n=1 Tax=Candidatus Protofrankia californiensis TaxID=1839754 RepID=A0A1C3P302_9ACTN|nr:MFS transporter [Protofrankia symbiont of Coriaria ruscifolia]SBW24166.1 major facilitator superfamily protein [Candidatus Protofrankia californiensis]